MTFKKACELIWDEDIESLRKMKKFSSFINTTDDEGYTLLCLACESGLLEVAKFLLSVTGIDVNKSTTVSGYHHQQRKKYCKVFTESKWSYNFTSRVYKDEQAKSPLQIACEEEYIEIVKLLLQHSNIRIDDGAKQAAIKSGIGDLEQLQVTTRLQQQCLFLQRDVIISLNKPSGMNENDQLFGTSIIVFKPLLSKLLPSFHNQVIENKKFIESLNEKEVTILQSIIDFVIFGSSNLTVNNEETSLIVLALLSQVKGDLVDLKTKSLDYIIDAIHFENILDILDALNLHLKREEQIFGRETSFRDQSVLQQLKDYCLNYIGANSDKPGFEKYIENDENNRCTFELVKSFFKRKVVKRVSIHELPNNISQTPLYDLYQEKTDMDAEIQLSNGKSVKCHKTILSSKVPYFRTLFSGNWNNTLDVYGEELEYIIQYCYGFVSKVPDHLMIPLMKKAHEYELEELLKVLQSAFTIYMDNFFETAQSLEDYLDDPTFNQVKTKLVDFGIRNKKCLFTKVNADLLRRLPKLDTEILLALANN
ncbi:hypothetical protein C9374_008811 [Naegleria lovaniensis]|uniref:BTB domain-containing protein n=1 Tax=Naegleria lovaniensis TaxID=51637 RepID=A0AA88KH21_NAELO|nr:uncharacterized protein C9374_008811 [Naegleria lovaniensis]KAG2377726.1 hypothetical protein C9374_008811 [Naegleria lovaniensis]